MIQPQNSQDTVQGSSQEWDLIWKKIGTGGNDRAKVFTRSTPKTIFQFWQRSYFDDLMLMVAPEPDWQFLELASGRGTTSLYLASRGFKNITLVDLSATALEQAKKNFASENVPQPTLVCANAESTGLPSDQYDCIYNIGVLEHFEDPSRILAESFRLLKPGGTIFMPIVPAMPFSHSILCRLFVNPISFASKIAKITLGRNVKPKTSDMVRTATGIPEYEQQTRTVGFENVQCLPYNPYWKLYSDGSRFEERFVIPIYRAHRSIKSMLGVTPSLKTWSSTSLCLLLTAAKPQGKSPR
jgi:ubiquinone/menaquinone biosynthesis C-methylase UbiE